MITSPDIISIITVVILAITALAGIVYAVITWGMWTTSILQTKQSLMPLPIVYRRSRDERGNLATRFFVKNIGYGPALNIQFERFDLTADNSKYSFKLRLIDPNVLAKDEERELQQETFKNGERRKELDLSVHLDPSYAEIEIPLGITYQDITGRTYNFKIIFGKGNLRIENPPQELKNTLQIAE